MSTFERMSRAAGSGVKQIHDGFANLYEVKPKGHQQDWGFLVLETTNSVGILITDDEGFLTVYQQRPAMVTPVNPMGLIQEAPAGRRDYKASLIELIINEVLEETGLRIGHESIRLLNGGYSMAVSPGIITEEMALAHVRLKGKILRAAVGAGFGKREEGEKIVTSFVSFEEVQSGSYIFQDLKLFGLVHWYLDSIKR